MGALEFFGLSLSKPTGSAYLPDIFPMPMPQAEFVNTDIQTVYAKILSDVIERTEGIPEDAQAVLWDSCLQNEAPDGLVTLLSKAMERKERLFIVYKEGVVRRATSVEELQIRSDYEKTGKSKVGVFISFTNYKRTDMVKLYSVIEYCVISSLYKGSQVSKALQYKIADLRKSVSLTDSAEAKAQAKSMAEALAAGKDILMDGGDEVASHKPDLEATKASIEFLDSKRCFYLGLPRSYINGEQPGGLGDSGIGDAKAIERGLKQYFVSIIKPVMSAIFGQTVTFKGTDVAQIDVALEAIKTFELAGDALISLEDKKTIVMQLLGLSNEADSKE